MQTLTTIAARLSKSSTGPTKIDSFCAEEKPVIELERMARAESKLDQHQERINRLDAAIGQAMDAQALLNRNIIQLSEQSKTMITMQALLGKIEARQEKTAEHIYTRLREVEVSTVRNEAAKLQGDGLFAN
jgi:uncharacterized protein (DUF3084 family)